MDKQSEPSEEKPAQPEKTGSATQAVDADAAAKVDAESYDAADPSQVTAGMSASEIAALRNWNDLELSAKLKAARKQKVARKFVVTGTCPEEAWPVYEQAVSEFVGAPPEERIFCGVAIGHADPEAPINSLTTDREPLEIFAEFV